MSYSIDAWRSAFLFTQAVEIPIYVVAVRHAQRQGWSERPRSLELQILLAFGASAITHPAVWYLVPLVVDPGRSYIEYVAVAEMWAVVVEAFYFYSLHVAWLGRSFVWSILANALSAGLGQVSRHYFGWP